MNAFKHDQPAVILSCSGYFTGESIVDVVPVHRMESINYFSVTINTDLT